MPPIDRAQVLRRVSEWIRTPILRFRTGSSEEASEAVAGAAAEARRCTNMLAQAQADGPAALNIEPAASAVTPGEALSWCASSTPLFSVS